MSDERFMSAALEEAERALEAGEPPFGCVLVSPAGNIVLRDHDRVHAEQDMAAHAETILLRRACRTLGLHSLNGYTLYTTVEPCAMCFTSGWLNGLSRIVYGASMQAIAEATNQKQLEIVIPCEEVNRRSGGKISILAGVHSEKAIQLFSHYNFG